MGDYSPEMKAYQRAHRRQVNHQIELDRVRQKLQKEAKLPWTLDAALLLIKELSPLLLEVGFDAGLLGSVLLRGESTHDLDLVVFPQDASCYDLQQARNAMGKAGMTILWHRHEIAGFWHKKRSGDTKHVEVWAHFLRRVDVFFLR